jgi:hypothetical protein
MFRTLGFGTYFFLRYKDLNVKFHIKEILYGNIFHIMSRLCPVCNTFKPPNDFRTRSYCQSCFNIKRKAKREEDAANADSKFVLPNLTIDVNDEEKFEEALVILEAAKAEMIHLHDKKPILSLPYEVPEIIYKYFKKCIDRGTSLTRIEGSIYAKISNEEFLKTFEIERPEFIKVSHKLTYLIDYIRVFREAYNIFIEDYNFNNRRINPDFKKIPDITTFYNFNTKSIEISDNILRLTPEVFIQKIKDETQELHVLIYFHLEHYFDQYYELYGLV